MFWPQQKRRCARCGALCHRRDQQTPTLKAGRRLQLAAGQGRATGIMIIPQGMGSNAAQTRWDARPKFSTPNDALMQWSLVKTNLAPWPVGMFAGMKKRIISLWFPRLHRSHLVTSANDRTFAVTAHAQNTDRLLCVNQEAQSAGLERGMSLSDGMRSAPVCAANPITPKQINIS